MTIYQANLGQPDHIYANRPHQKGKNHYMYHYADNFSKHLHESGCYPARFFVANPLCLVLLFFIDIHCLTRSTNPNHFNLYYQQHVCLVCNLSHYDYSHYADNVHAFVRIWLVSIVNINCKNSEIPQRIRLIAITDNAGTTVFRRLHKFEPSHRICPFPWNLVLI